MKANIKGLLEELGNRSDRLGIDSLSEVERTIVVANWAKAVIDNGGFRYFMEFPSDGLADASTRFRALGLEMAANALDEACRILHLEGREPLDEVERSRIHRSTDWPRLREAEVMFYQVSDERFDAAIEAYAREHGLVDSPASA